MSGYRRPGECADLGYAGPGTLCVKKWSHFLDGAESQNYLHDDGKRRLLLRTDCGRTWTGKRTSEIWVQQGRREGLDPGSTLIATPSLTDGNPGRTPGFLLPRPLLGNWQRGYGVTSNAVALAVPVQRKSGPRYQFGHTRACRKRQ